MVIPSIESSNWSPRRYFSNSTLFWNSLTPRPRPALLCLVIKGLVKWSAADKMLSFPEQKIDFGVLILCSFVA